MMEITLPKIRQEKLGEFQSKFIIEPLFPGFGPTIGNALRRVLFSSMQGAAVYNVKVDGVSHEFSKIKGVKEDMIEIILNLKSLRLKIFEGNNAALKLDAKGPKTVTAKDFKVPSSVEIINPDQKIATLSKNTSLRMEISVKLGMGYEPVENREDEKLPLGTIAIDSLFSPIKKVSYTLENTRVGKMTNYDKLTLIVSTDGTVNPADVFKKAAQILIEQFQLITQMDAVEKAPKPEKKAAKTDINKIEDLKFSKRTLNALLANKIATVKNLQKLNEEKLQTIKGLGEKGLTEINRKLEKLGA